MWDNISGAIRGSDAQLVRFYLTREPELIYEQNYHEETLLHHAARQADAETILEILKSGAKPDCADEFGWTPLHEACRSNNEAAAALFIKTGMNVNLLNSRRETPLHVAARKNASAIVARLLEAGAKIDAANKSGNTPLHLAAQKGHGKTLQLLINAGADLRRRNEIGLTALHMAATKGNFQCADILLKNRANPLQLDDLGRTFLEVADLCGNQLFISHCRKTILQLAETAEEQEQEPCKSKKEKPVLANYYNDSCLHSNNQLQKTCNLVVNDLISGQSSHNYAGNLIEYLENTLWFVVYPFLIFLLWKGFYSGTIPALVNINLSLGSLMNTETVRALTNTIILLLVSDLLVSTETETLSPLHFVRDLRSGVHFRVAHLLFLEAFFVDKLTIESIFFQQFATFWFFYIIIYAGSYLAWWLSTHVASRHREEAATEICYAHD